MAKSKQKQPQSADEIIQEENSKKEERDFSELINQIEKEYSVAWYYLKPKWDTWATRLKLYNNQRRDAEKVGDPLLFTTFQTVMASLYEDRLTSKWGPRKYSDIERAENLNALAEYDHSEMEKDQLDYEWDWDTMFFGRGYQLIMEFDKDLNVPTPEVIDPMTALRDPYAKSVQGDMKGRGASSFFGWETTITKKELNSSSVYFNTKNLKQYAPHTKGNKSRMSSNHEARNEAQGRGSVPDASTSKLVGDNKVFRVLNWFTYWRGDLVFVTLAEDRTKIIRFEKLKKREGEKIRRIPIVDRTLFPIAHDWDGVSIPDMVEDKQRARAVLQNLALDTAKANLHPRLVYDASRINSTEDLNYNKRQHIPVNGDPTGAVQPIQDSGVRNEVRAILGILDTAAQRAMATPQMQQGIMSDENRTATEITEVSQSVDDRFSLASRIFGWSEKRFWREWYKLYKDNFADKIDEKLVRLEGAGDFRWYSLTNSDIITDVDPDVIVESQSIQEAKNTRDFKKFQIMLKQASQNPEANVRFGQKYMGQLLGFKQDLLDTLMPPTYDEMEAREENEKLSEGTKVNVERDDDHMAHLYEHSAASNTPQKKAHINAHKKAMKLQKRNPELFNTNNPIPTGLNPSGGMGVEGLEDMMSESGQQNRTQGRTGGREVNEEGVGVSGEEETTELEQ